MNEDDSRWMDLLIDDALFETRMYKVVVDNDSVWIENIKEERVCHEFSEYGYELILQLFKYLDVNAEMC